MAAISNKFLRNCGNCQKLWQYKTNNWLVNKITQIKIMNIVSKWLKMWINWQKLG